MRYMDYTAYKQLNSKIKSIKWAIYLPAKQGPSETSGNSSLLNSTTSLLKQTLSDTAIPQKESSKIINNLRDKHKEFMSPLKGESVLVIISSDDSVDLYELPLAIDSGYITDLPDYFLKPVSDFYSREQSYYFLELHQNGCHLYMWDINGIKKIEDTDIQKSLHKALMLDEAAGKNIQTHNLSKLNDGMSEAVHGQGSYKDRRKAYIKQYLQYIDKQLSKYSHTTIAPVILVGSKQLSYAFKKISHNKHNIKGYLSNIPNKIDLSNLSPKPV